MHSTYCSLNRTLFSTYFGTKNSGLLDPESHFLAASLNMMPSTSFPSLSESKSVSNSSALAETKSTTLPGAESTNLPGTESVYALHVWPCAVHLAQYVWQNRREFVGKRLLELGAGGTGLPGLTALKAGAAHVTFTDAQHHSAAFDLLTKNVRANFSPIDDEEIDQKFSILELDWRRLDRFLHDHPPSSTDPLDLILASDCFYDPSVFESCLWAISLLLTEYSACSCIFSYEIRDSNWTIGPLLDELELECQLVDPASVHSDCVHVDDPTFRQHLRAHTVLLGVIRRKKLSGGAKKARGPPAKDYSPLEWTLFFDEKQSVSLDDGSRFNVYIKGKSGIVFYLLHGGGYSGLTWSCLAEELSNLIDCTFVAPDLRGHGDSDTKDDVDLSTDTQVKDIKGIFDTLAPVINGRPVFLIGHSMGGALAVHVAPHIANLAALCVIDVVEGSALDALKGMQIFLRSRPDRFKSVEHAVEWCVKSGTVRNTRSARVSMPSQVVRVTGETSAASSTDPAPLSHNVIEECVAEEPEDEEKEQTDNNASTTDNVNQPQPKMDAPDPPPADASYRWRIDLMESEPHWVGWFSGLSAKFLDVHAPKLLLLAGVDRLDSRVVRSVERLDKDLTVGQMQGKFMLLVLPKVGHCVHEDNPSKVADALASFCVRNKFCQPKQTFEPVYPGC